MSDLSKLLSNEKKLHGELSRKYVSLVEKIQEIEDDLVNVALLNAGCTDVILEAYKRAVSQYKELEKLYPLEVRKEKRKNA